MYKFKTLFAHSLLLAPTPAIVLHPHEPTVQFQMQQIHHEEQNISNLSYDALIQLFERIESGEWEEGSSSGEMKQFVAFLAREGILSDEEGLALEEDIQDLLSEEESFYRHTSYMQHGCTIVPAILYSYGQVLACKNKKNKQRL